MTAIMMMTTITKIMLLIENATKTKTTPKSSANYVENSRRHFSDITWTRLAISMRIAMILLAIDHWGQYIQIEVALDEF